VNSKSSVTSTYQQYDQSREQWSPKIFLISYFLSREPPAHSHARTPTTNCDRPPALPAHSPITGGQPMTDHHPERECNRRTLPPSRAGASGRDFEVVHRRRKNSVLDREVSSEVSPVTQSSVGELDRAFVGLSVVASRCVMPQPVSPMTKRMRGERKPRK
jgi:hypothetical protein